MSSIIPITLTPTAGFCVKSTVVQAVKYTPIAQLSNYPNVLEPRPEPIVIPTGFKIFINLAWESSVPPPPEADEAVIKRAMEGEDPAMPSTHSWYVPVVVSEGRLDRDKAGKPSLVFDCVFNKSVRTRTLHDAEFKFFLVELALQRIEAQTPLVLSRQISTPNITSKGTLHPRTVSIPTFLSQKRFSSPRKEFPSEKSLVEEIPIQLPTGPVPPTPSTWSWEKVNDSKLRVTIKIPNLDRGEVENTTLDLEPRRVLLQAPRHAPLDINLSLSDADINETVGADTETYVLLKQQRPFDVDNATAEWHIANNILIVTA